MKTFPFPSMLVGMTRFELATSGPPDRCATGLRHIPSSECACKKKLAIHIPNASAKVLLFFEIHKKIARCVRFFCYINFIPFYIFSRQLRK